MTKPTSVWMPLYVGDYLADTGHLSTAEHGAYLLLIMHYWRSGPLTTDETQLARLTRMTASEWGASRATLLAFFKRDGEQWRHKRIDDELVRSARNFEAKSAGGRAAAHKRWHGHASAIAEASASDAAATTEATLSDAPSPSPSPSPSESESQAPAPIQARSADADAAVAKYNAVAERVGWPKVSRLTTPRARKLGARLRDCGGLEGWLAAMDRAENSAFLRGETGRNKAHEAWVPNLDFFLQEASFTKLIEGQYDTRESRQERTGFDALTEGARRAAGLGAVPRKGNVSAYLEGALMAINGSDHEAPVIDGEARTVALEAALASLPASQSEMNCDG